MKIGLRQPPLVREMGFEAFCAWVKEAGFDHVDLGRADAEQAKILADNGLEVGSVDLPNPKHALLNEDESALAEAVEVWRRELPAAAEIGAKAMFTVLLPPDQAQPRSKSADIAARTLPQLAERLEANGLSLAIEGWPGGGPQYPALGCTPETLRRIFADTPSAAIGICFDPSHLVRLGVCYKRFLAEFGCRVRHAHGKDTIFNVEERYLCGNLDSSFGGMYVCGDRAWRYTIPGEGIVDWQYVADRLADAKYDGRISVELEDHHFWQTPELQQEGLRRSLALLKKVAGRV